MVTDQEVYDELCYYTLAHGDLAFIHQHVVDAFAAQTSGENDKPIKITFALVGLYLHVEKQYSGRQVQLAHMKLAREKQQWPVFELPSNRGEITIRDVIATPAGAARDEMIHLWCVAVWNAFRDSQPIVANLLSKSGII